MSPPAPQVSPNPRFVISLCQRKYFRAKIVTPPAKPMQPTPRPVAPGAPWKPSQNPAPQTMRGGSAIGQTVLSFTFFH